MEFNIRQDLRIEARVTQRTDQEVQQAIALTIGRIIAHKVDEWLMQKTEEDLKEEIQNLIHRGILERPSPSIKCPECGTIFWPEEPFCPTCNWRQDIDEGEDAREGDRLKIEELDAEETADEDVPRSENSKEVEDDMPAEQGIHMFLSSFLKEKGFSQEEANLGAFLMVCFLNNMTEWNTNEFKKRGTQLIIETQFAEETKKEVLQIWNKVALIPELKKFLDITSVWNEIRAMVRSEEPKILIRKVGTEFKVIVKNPFEGFEVSNPKHKVPLLQTGRSRKYHDWEMGMRFYYSRFVNLPETLRKIGEALLIERKDYFEASTKEEAEKILKVKPLTERELAKRAGVHYSTINKQKNKWARLIETPWGAKYLQDFLEPASAGTKEKRISAVEEIIREMIQKFPEMSERRITARVLQQELEKMDIFLPIRTINYIRAKIKQFAKEDQGTNSAQNGY